MGIKEREKQKQKILRLFQVHNYYRQLQMKNSKNHLMPLLSFSSMEPDFGCYSNHTLPQRGQAEEGSYKSFSI